MFKIYYEYPRSMRKRRTKTKVYLDPNRGKDVKRFSDWKLSIDFNE